MDPTLPSASPPLSPLSSTPLKNHDVRRYIVICIGGLFLAILIFIGIWWLSKQEPRSSVSTNSATNHNAIATNVPLTPYKSSSYTIKYPSSWQMKVMNETSSDSTVLFGPYLDARTGVPGIIVDSRPATSAADMSERQHELEQTFGMSASPVHLSFGDTTLFRGVIPYTIIRGVISHVPHYEKVMYFYQKQRLYTLTYTTSEESAVSNATFSAVLNSFTLSQ